MRWDHHSTDRVTAVSPTASVSVMLSPGTRVQLGFGQYVQYPEITLLTSPLGSRALLPMRSVQAIAAVEQRLGARTRLRAEYYDRVDRDLPFQPLFDPRLLRFCEEAIAETVGKVHKLPSGPLHDAAEMGRAGVPTVMMFVQSLHGISHNKIEDTKEEHLEQCVAAFDRLAEKTIAAMA